MTHKQLCVRLCVYVHKEIVSWLIECPEWTTEQFRRKATPIIFRVFCLNNQAEQKWTDGMIQGEIMQKGSSKQ